MNPDSQQERDFVDEFHEVSIRDERAVLSFIRSHPHPLHAVTAFGVDIPEIIASSAKERGLHSPCTLDNARISKDKYEAKRRMESHGVRLPQYLGSENDREEAESFAEKERGIR
ncbi:MAG: hypothetical protein M0C28_31975 [Candidatus Moduliflexus flocculans]|nr:hypothetical protein [Candidatus Moduliflexus flocculans]